MIKNSTWLASGKSALFLVGLVAVVICLCQSTSPFQAQGRQKNGGAEQTIKPQLKVAVKRQTDAPIAIKVSSVSEMATGSPQIAFVITNLGDKAIRAYTIRWEATIGSSHSAGMVLTNINVQESIFTPGQSRSESLSSLPSSTTPITRLVLTVDYVEFLDGASWGPDVQKSAEMLAGQRAGARAEADRLLRLLNTRGPSSVIESYTADESETLVPSGNSEKWVQGFRSGRDTFRARLRNSKQSSLDELRTELQRPFDLSGRLR
ncbi:MAG TPA: hypothetical protein VN937_12500 [Blastocatellia bacterium]|nr:hypothetical protein [Blastocatellia bacterium]